MQNNGAYTVAKRPKLLIKKKKSKHVFILQSIKIPVIVVFIYLFQLTLIALTV